MTKAFELMTRAPATCAPDARVSDVAAIMRERNIGAVIVLSDGKPHGIVTDRDLAMRALGGGEEFWRAPVSRCMSAPLITGAADWSIERVSDVMARHQVRRLPIVEDGQLTGIISLGDLARHAGRKQTAVNVLRAISQPGPGPVLARWARSPLMRVVAVAASATTVVAMLAANRAQPGGRRKALRSDVIAAARRWIGPAPRASLRKLGAQAASTLHGLSAHTLALARPRRRLWPG